MGRPTVPAIAGAAAAAAPSRERVICSCGCGNIAETSFDAIGNLNYRCPLRRRSSVVSRIAPEHTFVPLRLVRQSDAEAALLPPVEPGQLRCQICAQGVEGKDRYCVKHRLAKLARRAKAWRVAHRGTFVVTCSGCGSVRPRKGGKATCRTCPVCAPKMGTHKGRVYQPKPCERCQKPFTPTGPRSKWHPGGCP